MRHLSSLRWLTLQPGDSAPGAAACKRRARLYVLLQIKKNSSLRLLIMSAVTAKEAGSNHVQQCNSVEENKTAKKKKKKSWTKLHKKKSQLKQEKRKAKVNQTVPPVNAQHFSANWKSLQEMIKVSETEKDPEKAQQQNGSLPKEKSKESLSNKTKDSATQKQKDIVKPVDDIGVTTPAKDTSVNNRTGSASTAPKRKKDFKNKQGGEQGAKKFKAEMKASKPTEEDIWFDDVDPDDIEATVGAEAAEIMRKKQGIHKSRDVESVLVKEKAFEGLTKAVAIDCEMVGVGPDGEDSILARVSLVNQFGKCIYDKYVKPTEKVTDYRTHVSGIRPEDIRNGEDVNTVRREVGEILRGRIVVGHAIHNDLKILLLDHPKKKIRDTQKYEPFKKIAKSGRPALRVLCREVLNVKVQQGEHSSVQDAQATMRLYTTVKKQWEAQIKAGLKDKDKKRKRKPAKITKRTNYSS